MDDRIGPFGQGWTHAYDIRTEEENPTTNQTDDSLNYVDRSDFFAGKHKYYRDADGLYSPPPYLFDETESAFDSFLVSGPIQAMKHPSANPANRPMALGGSSRRSWEKPFPHSLFFDCHH